MKTLKKAKKYVAYICIFLIMLSLVISYLEDNKEAYLSSESQSTFIDIPMKLYLKLTNIISPTEANRIQLASKQLFQEIYSSLLYNDNFQEKGIVKKVIDGDTIVVLVNGVEEKIRMIGVNTPESVGKYLDNPQYYGKEASNFTKKNLLGKHVYLERDRGDTDRFGRYLRYVWLKNPEEGTIKDDLFNAILIAEGYGEVMIISPNDKYADLFKGLEKVAKASKNGMWSK